MQSLTIFLVIFGAMMTQGVSKPAPGVPPLILYQHSEVNPDGSFQYSYETENGIRVAESGYLKNIGSQDEAQVVQGTYSYTAPDGTPITVTYTADENGFRAQGAHLPVVPEIPVLIAKALAYNAAKAGAKEVNDNQKRPKPQQRPTTTRRILPTTVGFASGTEI